MQEIINERRKTHGEFHYVATMTQEIYKNITQYSSSQLTDMQRESLHMICSKLARIGCGDPNVQDHWIDIAGYATLIAQAMPYPPAK